MRTRKAKRLALALAVLFAGITGTAAAVITSTSGGLQVSVDKRTSDTASSTNNMFWSDVPGASVVVDIPAGAGSRLYDVPFFAESQCSSNQMGGCTVRIIAVNLVNGAITELSPQSGADFAFDSDEAGGADDLREGHAMERSARLPAVQNGPDYQIEVQYAVTNPATTFTLDDWHLAVIANQ